MCGSMRLRSGERLKLGGDLWARGLNDKQVFHGPWKDWAREEKLHTTWSGLLKPGLLIGQLKTGPDGRQYYDTVESYFERDKDTGQLVEFGLPEKHVLYVGQVLTKLNWQKTYLPGDILVITRFATPQEMGRCHHDRHPVTMPWRKVA